MININSKFLCWYTQALGAALGLASCVYSYLKGYMAVYGNIHNNFDYLWIGGIISSYFLFPLCIVTLVLAITKPYSIGKSLYKIPIHKLNSIIIKITVIIGLLGARASFIIPSIFILTDIFINYYNSMDSRKSEVNYEIKQESECIINHNTVTSLEEQHIDIELVAKEKNMLARIEIATDLLKRNASVEFISELSGLSLKELQELNENIKQDKINCPSAN